jgi:hypothetical protein
LINHVSGFKAGVAGVYNHDEIASTDFRQIAGDLPNRP